MEAEMKEMDEKLGKNYLSEDDNFDEAIPIQIRKERTTESYKDNMNEILKPLTKMIIVKKQFKKLNGDQYMRLQMKIISKHMIYFQMILSQKVKNVQTNHKTYQVM